eukprot:scaffold141789_cov32-Tisochrysis_lutea.AAC.3
MGEEAGRGKAMERGLRSAGVPSRSSMSPLSVLKPSESKPYGISSLESSAHPTKARAAGGEGS